MKKISALLFAVLLSPLAFAAEFIEGTHFEVVSQAKPTTTPEIVEYFSFKCPACYRFEPLVEAMLAKKADNIKFKKNHVDFIGGPVAGPELTRVYAIINLLKVEDKITPALFSAIHQERKTFPSLSDYRQFFVDNGVDGEKFDKAAKSFMVKTHISKMQRNTKKFAISGVPTFIVNGKYKVITKSITSNEEFEQLVFFLTQKSS